MDDEPPPRPWWQRLLIPAAVILAAGAIGAAVTWWPGSGPGSGPGPGSAAGPQDSRLAGLTGRIIAVAPDQYLVVSDPQGSKPVEVKALGNVGDAVYPALDNRYLSLGNGQVVATSPTRIPVLASTRVGLFPGDQNSGFIEPFANHDRELVVMLAPSFDTATDFVVSEVSLATGRSVKLGIAHQVAGDPRGRGVFVSVAAPVVPTTSTTDVAPDSSVELRDGGRPQALLATAAAINHALGQDPRLPVELTPYPNPSGTKIAVTVQPQGGGSTSGVVILNRAGRALGIVATPKGPPARMSSAGRRPVPRWPSPRRARADPRCASGVPASSALSRFRPVPRQTTASGHRTGRRCCAPAASTTASSGCSRAHPEER